MCGIVGLLIKEASLRESLGKLVTPMLDCMGTRGPDSAGLAVFTEPIENGQRRFCLYSTDWEQGGDWYSLLHEFVNDGDGEADLDCVAHHAMMISTMPTEEFKAWIADRYPVVHVLSAGRYIEVFKDEGHPREIIDRYSLIDRSGTHAIGHTRMATESMVSPAHAHPYTAGEDFCLVHNGSLSNPHSVRRNLERRGIRFETDNDTEAGCRYLEWRMSEGDSLEAAIEKSFSELDGFFTFLMATADRMVLVRDTFSCKPAVAAETDDYVAVASEYRSLAHLPGIKDANVFEPMPEQIYSWSVV